MIKVGTHVEAAKTFRDYEKKLSTTLGGPASEEELADYLDITERMVEAICLRFSKTGTAKMRLVDVALKMGISIERVRQLLGLGLRRVRNFEQREENDNRGQDIY